MYDEDEDNILDELDFVIPSNEEIVQDMISQLIMNDELMQEFNLQMRRHKLNKIKRDEK